MAPWLGVLATGHGEAREQRLAVAGAGVGALLPWPECVAQCVVMCVVGRDPAATFPTLTHSATRLQSPGSLPLSLPLVGHDCTDTKYVYYHYPRL